MTWVLFGAGLWIVQGGLGPHGRTVFKVRYAENVSSSWSMLGRERDVFYGFLGGVVGTLFAVINPTDLLIDPVNPIINTSTLRFRVGQT